MDADRAHDPSIVPNWTRTARAFASIADRPWWCVALIVAIVAVLGWVTLDLGVGLIMGLIMAPTWYAAEAFAGAARCADHRRIRRARL